MRSRSRLLGFVIGTVVALACGSSLAYFTTTGAGSTSAAVSTLTAPAITTATPVVGGTVNLAWSAATAPGAEAVTYFVTRDGGDALGNCATSAAPATATSCVDKEVAPGEHTYVVTALWGKWQTPSPARVATVIVGAATHLTIAAATATPVAGATNNLTIAARDVNESVVTNYTGAKSLTFSGAGASPAGTPASVINSSNVAINFGSATAITFTNGIATVASARNGVLRVYKAGPAAISVTDGTLPTETPLALTVSPAALAKFVLGVETTTPVAGNADDLTISAQDTYGNVITTHTGPKSLIFSGGTTSGAGNVATVSNLAGEAIPFGSATQIEFTAGVATVDGAANGEMRLYKSAAAQTIKVAEGAILSPTVSVTPTAATAARFIVSASATTFATTSSTNLTITAQDPYGNTATAYTGAKSLTFSGAAASPAGNAPTVAPASTTTGVAFGTATAITFTNGVAAAASSKNGTLKIFKVGAAAITVTDGTISNPTPLALTVTVGALSKFVVAGETATPVAGAADSLAITAQDAYGNVVTTYGGAKSLTFSGVAASPGGTVSTVSDKDGNAVALGTATPINFVEGVSTTAVGQNGEARIYRTGLSTFRVAEGAIFGTLNVTPTAASPAKFGIASSLATFAAGASSNLTLTAQDTYGNTATSYAGAKQLTFSGAAASPGGTAPTVANAAGTAIAFGSETELTFVNGVAAVTTTKNGVLRLYRAGATQVAATDGTISTATPVTITVTAVAAGATSKLVWTDITVSAGTVGSPCLFTCAITGLGNSGTVTGGVAVTDTYGNVNTGIGTGHTAAVTVVSGGGTVTSGTFTFPSTGAAESPVDFTYTAPTTGAYTASLKAATTASTAYANATATATK